MGKIGERSCIALPSSSRRNQKDITKLVFKETNLCVCCSMKKEVDLPQSVDCGDLFWCIGQSGQSTRVTAEFSTVSVDFRDAKTP